MRRRFHRKARQRERNWSYIRGCILPFKASNRPLGDIRAGEMVSRKRMFEIDMEDCPNCGGEIKIIAAILEAPVIEKILTHLGLQARAPPRSPARGQALQAA